jgi:hypothetical protein
MARGDDVKDLEEWIPTPVVAELLKVSDSGARDLALDERDVFGRARNVRRLRYKGGQVYIVRRSAVERERKRRQNDAEAAKPRRLAAEQRSFRVAVRAYWRSLGNTLRMDRNIPDEAYAAYLEAHPDVKPPDGYREIPS